MRNFWISTRIRFEKSVFLGENRTFVVTSTGPSRRSEKKNQKQLLQKIEKNVFVACRLKQNDEIITYLFKNETNML